MTETSIKLNKALGSINFFLVTAILLYGFSFLFLGAYFSHPNAEDFSLTANAKNYSILYSIKEVLVNYDGRYFTNFLHAINPLAFGCVACYKWINVFSLIFPIFCLTFFLKGLSPKTSTFKVILGSALFALVNYAISPSIVHQVYWMVSSFVYHYSWCFYLLWTGSFIRFINIEDGKTKNFWFLTSSILLVSSMGMNEMFLVLNCMTLLGIFIYLRTSKSEEIRSSMPIFLTALIAIIFFVSNPGISKRLHSFDDQQSTITLGGTLVKSVMDFWQESIYFLSYSFLIFPLLILFILYLKKDPFHKTSSKLGYIILAFVALLISVLAFYVPMGFEKSIPVRIYTTIYFGLLLVLCFGIGIWGHKKLIHKKIRFSSLQKQLLSLVCLIFIGASLLLSENNIALLKTDYESGKMESFNEQYKNRYAILENTKNLKNSCWKKAELPILMNTPLSIYHQPDIKANRMEAYWNKAFENYFLIDEVSLSGDSTSLLKQTQNNYLP